MKMPRTSSKEGTPPSYISGASFRGRQHELFARLVLNWIFVLVLLLVARSLLTTTGLSSDTALLWSVLVAFPIGTGLELWRQRRQDAFRTSDCAQGTAAPTIWPITDHTPSQAQTPDVEWGEPELVWRVPVEGMANRVALAELVVDRRLVPGGDWQSAPPHVVIQVDERGLAEVKVGTTNHRETADQARELVKAGQVRLQEVTPLEDLDLSDALQLAALDEALVAATPEVRKKVAALLSLLRPGTFSEGLLALAAASIDDLRRAVRQLAVLRTLAGVIKDPSQGVVQLEMPVQIAFGSGMLGQGKADDPSVGVGIGFFRKHRVLLPSESGDQKSRLVGQRAFDVDGVRVEIRLFQYRQEGGDLPLAGYGVVLVDPVTGNPVRAGLTDKTGQVSFRRLPPEVARQSVRLFLLPPSFLSKIPLQDDWTV